MNQERFNFFVYTQSKKKVREKLVSVHIIVRSDTEYCFSGH